MILKTNFEGLKSELETFTKSTGDINIDTIEYLPYLKITRNELRFDF